MLDSIVHSFYNCAQLKMDEYATYHRAWKKEWESERKRVERRRHQAIAEAERLAHILVDEYGVTRVILFGSATGSRDFTESSDIDIAVEGLAKERFFEVAGRLLDASRFAIDLKAIEDLEPFVLTRVYRGVTLYEA